MTKKFKVGDVVKVISYGGKYYEPSERKAGLTIGLISTIREYLPENHHSSYRVVKLDSVGVSIFEFQLELVENARISIFDLQEGKIYSANGCRYRRKNNVLEVLAEDGSNWFKSSAHIGDLTEFEEITIKPLKVNSLSHMLEKQADGSLKVGCQHVSAADVKLIMEYLKGE